MMWVQGTASGLSLLRTDQAPVSGLNVLGLIRTLWSFLPTISHQDSEDKLALLS